MGIFIAAFIMSLGVLFAFGTLGLHWANGNKRYLIPLLLALPLSPVVNLYVKHPIFDGLRNVWDIPKSPTGWPIWYAVLVLIIIGITEEIIKLSPLLIKSVRSFGVDRRSTLALATFLGLGFGVGEAWYIAWFGYVNDPKIMVLPFYMFGGYMTERFIATLYHIIFLLFPLFGLIRNIYRIALGLIVAILLHMFVDISPILYQMKIISTNAAFITLIIEAAVASFLFLRFVREFDVEKQPLREAKSGRVLYTRDEAKKEYTRRS